VELSAAPINIVTELSAAPTDVVSIENKVKSQKYEDFP